MMEENPKVMGRVRAQAVRRRKVAMVRAWARTTTGKPVLMRMQLMRVGTEMRARPRGLMLEFIGRDTSVAASVSASIRKTAPTPFDIARADTATTVTNRPQASKDDSPDRLLW
jgi:hypothetical protein